MNILSKMSPDDSIEIVMNGQEYEVTVGSIIKEQILLGDANGGYDELYYCIREAYEFGSEEDDKIDTPNIEFYKYRDEVFKVCLSNYYRNEVRKKQIKYEIEEKNRELLELKSEYFELTGDEYGN